MSVTHCTSYILHLIVCTASNSMQFLIAINTLFAKFWLRETNINDNWVRQQSANTLLETKTKIKLTRSLDYKITRYEDNKTASVFA